MKWYSEIFLRSWLNSIFTIETWYFIPHAFPPQQKPGMDLADTYIMFVRQNQDILREKINEEMYIEKLFDVSNCPCKASWHHRNMCRKNCISMVCLQSRLLFWSFFFYAARIVDNFISLLTEALIGFFCTWKLSLLEWESQKPSKVNFNKQDDNQFITVYSIISLAFAAFRKQNHVVMDLALSSKFFESI